MYTDTDVCGVPTYQTQSVNISGCVGDVEASSCDGDCPSNTHYDPETGVLVRNCTCCQPKTYLERTESLPCKCLLTTKGPSPNAVSMLGQHRRRSTDIEVALGYKLLSAIFIMFW